MTFKAPLDLTVHAPDGMYDPANEHDACGVGMVTTLNKRPERKIVTDAIEVLVNLDHRGAVGAEENTGDGAGILMSMPDEFMRATVPAELPEAGHYAAGIAFLDRDIETSGQQEQAIANQPGRPWPAGPCRHARIQDSRGRLSGRCSGRRGLGSQDLPHPQARRA